MQFLWPIKSILDWGFLNGPPDLFAHAPEAREAISDICHQAAFEITLISLYIITNMSFPASEANVATELCGLRFWWLGSLIIHERQDVVAEL